MTNIIMLVLASLTLISIIFSMFLLRKVLDLNDDFNKAKRELVKIKEDAKELVDIEAGDNAIIKNYGLMTKGDNPVSFKVTYEVEVLEVSVDSVKVKAIDYKSHDSYAKDPANRQSIINFMKDEWLKKHDVEMVMDDKKRRSLKLKQLGI
jgi:hypothetical protein